MVHLCPLVHLEKNTWKQEQSTNDSIALPWCFCLASSTYIVSRAQSALDKLQESEARQESPGSWKSWPSQSFRASPKVQKESNNPAAKNFGLEGWNRKGCWASQVLVWRVTMIGEVRIECQKIKKWTLEIDVSTVYIRIYLLYITYDYVTCPVLPPAHTSDTTSGISSMMLILRSWIGTLARDSFV